MAASSGTIRIEIELDGLDSNHELKAFHGYAVNEHSSITYSGKTATIKYSSRIENVSGINGKTSLFGIYVLERTVSDRGLPCIRIQGNIHFKAHELLDRKQTKHNHFRKHIKNHVLDDEIKSNYVLAKRENRILGHLEGTIHIIEYPQFKSGFSIPRKEVHELCIHPWYQSIKTHTTGFVHPVIENYHVPWMRFLTGPIIPFSTSMFWRNREFVNFESDPSKCSLFVGLIYGLLHNAVDLYPEFSSVDAFFHECKEFIAKDDFSKIGLSCLNVIMDIFILKAISEPYVTDRVSLERSKQQIHVDQYSGLCHIYGSDCEDGQKYAHELNRLISNSDWNRIISSLNNDSHAINILATVVKILRMTYNFCTTMYCGSDICHSVNVLIDCTTVKEWLGVDPGTRIKGNEEIPLKRIRQIKTFFIESTRYSSPFQNPFIDDDHHPTDDDHDRRVKMDFQGRVEQELDRVSEMDAFDNSVLPDGHNISSFYKFWTNLMTLDLLSLYPGVLDFLPITQGNLFGISLNDVHFNPRFVSIAPRIRFSDIQLNYFDEVVNGHHPNYDLIPNRFALFEKMFSGVSQIHKLMPSTKRFKSFNYIKINVYIIGVLKDIKTETSHINSVISKIMSRESKFIGFDYRIRQLYNSPQSYVFILYLQY